MLPGPLDAARAARRAQKATRGTLSSTGSAWGFSLSGLWLAVAADERRGGEAAASHESGVFKFQLAKPENCESQFSTVIS